MIQATQKPSGVPVIAPGLEHQNGQAETQDIQRAPILVMLKITSLPTMGITDPRGKLTMEVARFLSRWDTICTSISTTRAAFILIRR